MEQMMPSNIMFGVLLVMVCRLTFVCLETRIFLGVVFSL
uniref:Uncharacterized protein n=1 Tax=Aegilops tauschii subsp. strangulata TaxID=200361 RepID=A0A453CX80_AEGTS